MAFASNLPSIGGAHLEGEFVCCGCGCYRNEKTMPQQNKLSAFSRYKIFDGTLLWIWTCIMLGKLNWSEANLCCQARSFNLGTGINWNGPGIIMALKLTWEYLEKFEFALALWSFIFSIRVLSIILWKMGRVFRMNLSTVSKLFLKIWQSLFPREFPGAAVVSCVPDFCRHSAWPASGILRQNYAAD